MALIKNIPTVGAVHTGLMIDALEQKYHIESLTVGSSNAGRTILAILDGKYSTLTSSSSGTSAPYKTLDADFNEINSGNVKADNPANISNAMYVRIDLGNASLNNQTFTIS